MIYDYIIYTQHFQIDLTKRFPQPEVVMPRVVGIIIDALLPFSTKYKDATVALNKTNIQEFTRTLVRKINKNTGYMK